MNLSACSVPCTCFNIKALMSLLDIRRMRSRGFRDLAWRHSGCVVTIDCSDAFSADWEKTQAEAALKTSSSLQWRIRPTIKTTVYISDTGWSYGRLSNSRSFVGDCLQWERTIPLPTNYNTPAPYDDFDICIIDCNDLMTKPRVRWYLFLLYYDAVLISLHCIVLRI